MPWKRTSQTGQRTRDQHRLLAMYRETGPLIRPGNLRLGQQTWDRTHSHKRTAQHRSARHLLYIMYIIGVRSGAGDRAGLVPLCRNDQWASDVSWRPDELSDPRCGLATTKGRPQPDGPRLYSRLSAVLLICRASSWSALVARRPSSAWPRPRSSPSREAPGYSWHPCPPSPFAREMPGLTAAAFVRCSTWPIAVKRWGEGCG